jgi:hypothetical protein
MKPGWITENRRAPKVGQARGKFRPHPGPLPQERGNRTLRFRQSGAPRLVAARGVVFPLPEGEGEGEGEGRLQQSGTRRLAWRGALFSFVESGRLHRQFASALICRAFLPPHPSPLPEEREERLARSNRAAPHSRLLRGTFLLPHPAGGDHRRWDEPERAKQTSDGRSAGTAAPSPGGEYVFSAVAQTFLSAGSGDFPVPSF